MKIVENRMSDHDILSDAEREALSAGDAGARLHRRNAC